MDGQPEQQMNNAEENHELVNNDHEQDDNNVEHEQNNNDDNMNINSSGLLISEDDSDSDESVRQRGLACNARRDHEIGLLVGSKHLSRMPIWERQEAHRLIRYFALTEQCEFGEIMTNLACRSLEDVAYALRRYSTLADLWAYHSDYRNLGITKYAKVRGIEAMLKNRMETEGLGSTSLRKDKFKRTVRAVVKIEVRRMLQELGRASSTACMKQ